MKDLLEAAQRYHAARLSLLPNDAQAKYPRNFASWQKQHFDLDTLTRHIRAGGALGLRTGQGIEAIDVDTKAWDGPDPDDLITQFEALIAANAPGLLDHLVIVQTRSGGRHYLYRCIEIGGNQQLAKRPSTAQELAANPKAVSKALIETRGIGGQVQIAPSPGYTLLQGDYAQLPEITPAQRGTLLMSARALNRVVSLPPDLRGPGPERPGDHYNRNSGIDEALDLLLSAGWCVAGKRGESVQLTRPGGTVGNVHATYGHIGPGIFYPFTSNCAPFEPDTAYQPFTVYTLLNHAGDFKAAAKALAPRYKHTAPANGTALPHDVCAQTSPDQLPGGTFEDEPDPKATDLGNAIRFRRLFGATVRYVHTWAAWYVWNGTYWAKDDTGEVYQLARKVIQGIYGEAAQLDATEDRRTLGRWAVSCESLGRMNAMIEMAKSEAGIGTRHTIFDQAPWLLNCTNGTLDLRTGQLRPHDPADLLTKRIEIAYDPNAQAPVWERFLARITNGDTDLAEYLQRAMGYSLTGDTSEQCLFFLYGDGANGKSTFLNAVKPLLGPYYGKLHASSLLKRQNESGVPNDIAALLGVRMVVSSELANNQFDEEKIKDLTGGEPVSARFMRAEWFTFAPEFKIWLYGNNKPRIRGNDHGIWRRIRLIPFTATIPDSEKDSQLGKKLEQELPGILAWAVKGGRAWQQGGLVTPACVQEATEGYRSEMDTIGAFLGECCVVNARAYTSAGDLYAAYTAWCERSGERTLAKQVLGVELEKRGYRSVRTMKGFKREGIGLLSTKQYDPDDPDDPDSGISHERFLNPSLMPESGSSGSSGSSNNKIPPGCHLIQCDHKGNASTYGSYWKVTGPTGGETDPDQYQATVIWQAQRLWGSGD
jgi:P4 family phage/plasmid primase-like protien